MSTIDISVSGSGSINLMNTGDVSVFKQKLYGIVSWGYGTLGGDSSGVDYDEFSPILDVQNVEDAYAILKSDRTVESWGRYGDFTDNANTGQGDITSLLVDIDKIIGGSGRSFTAITNSGNAYSWGQASTGGDSTSVIGASITNGDTVEVYGYSLGNIARNTSGALSSWGVTTYSDFTNPSRYNNTQYPGGIASELSSGVTSIYIPKRFSYANFTYQTFAVFKSGGSLLTWGNQTYGGNSDDSVCTGGSVSSGIVSLSSSNRAYSAVKDNGSVVSWGDPAFGGNQVIENGASVAASLTSGVVSVHGSYNAFAALKDDNTVITWGSASSGGDSTGVTLTNVESLIGLRTSFAVIKFDGTAEVWGSFGLATGLIGGTLTDVITIKNNQGSYAALKGDGSVVCWGTASTGGDFTDNTYTGQGDLSSVLSSGVIDIIVSNFAFLAIKSDGTAYAWGNDGYGGDSSDQDLTGIISGFSTYKSFTVTTYK
jgi:hypothetical protein